MISLIQGIYKQKTENETNEQTKQKENKCREADKGLVVSGGEGAWGGVKGRGGEGEGAWGMVAKTSRLVLSMMHCVEVDLDNVTHLKFIYKPSYLN